jgi:hypothetical protein
VHDKDVKPTLEGCAANMLALRLCVEQMLADPYALAGRSGCPCNSSMSHP